MLQIYCGNGKGKTTAALGGAVRASGAGLRVCFAQFMKGSDTSELAALKTLPITVKRCDRDYGFFGAMSGADKSEITACHNGLLKFAFSGDFDFLVLDEFFSAYRHGLLDNEFAARLILNKKDSIEIVLTGREPPEIFLEKADYISEIMSRRHPYDSGITARKGIEF